MASVFVRRGVRVAVFVVAIVVVNVAFIAFRHAQHRRECEKVAELTCHATEGFCYDSWIKLLPGWRSMILGDCHCRIG